MTLLFDTALQRVCEVVMFENWLRFYFIAEEGDDLLIRLPEKTLQRLEEKYPTLVGLAVRLHNQPIDHQRSLEAVCLFVASDTSGVSLPEDVISHVFDSPKFHLELQLFSSWVQGHEEQLDEAFSEFSSWRDMFSHWKESDAVKEYVASLLEAEKRSAEGPVGTTQ